ncbi:hypothetical protein N803_02305 [Knoellia subterranea KCTC 19937]|uniref:Uncharacterized protein n=1 Tax=Knoellia subterranea KCTC 19937 TaxID=1385521 RepID=A0A0A0JU66_9MICO|nr:hypothetical protein N803_02305 [Knoellia subterranea KCTC 19937]
MTPLTNGRKRLAHEPRLQGAAITMNEENHL